MGLRFSNRKNFLIILFTLFLNGCVSTEKLERQYPSKPMNKAFALANDGRSGMSWGQGSPAAAIDTALQACRKNGAKGCRIVKLNGFVADSKPIDYFTTGDQNYGHSRVFRCNELTKSEAYSMLMQGHFYLDRDGDGHPCEWEKTTYRIVSSPTYQPKMRCHWVKGYRRKDGTYVSGHRRCR